MSLVVKFGDYTNPNQNARGMIYLDATTEFNKIFSGKVTSHPIESGVSVSDHFIVENPKFRVTGVISGADLSPIPANIFLEGEGLVNANPSPEAAIISNLSTSLRRFIPDSIEQYIPNLVPQVMGGNTARTDFKDAVESLLELIMSGVYFNEQRNRWENNMVLISLYETHGSYLGKSRDNLVLTGYSVKETPDTGSGLFLDLSFEQVRFATLQKATAPSPPKSSPTAKKSSPSVNCGNTSGTEVDSSTVETRPEPNTNRVYGTDTPPTE